MVNRHRAIRAKSINIATFKLSRLFPSWEYREFSLRRSVDLPGVMLGSRHEVESCTGLSLTKTHYFAVARSIFGPS